MSSGNEGQASGFTIGEQISLFIAVEGSMLSGVAVLFLVLYKLILFTRRALRRKQGRGTVKPPSDACDSSLFLSLLAGEMLRAVGASMSLRWVLDGNITNDGFCNAQGFLKLIGTNAIDFSTLGITVHTFSVLILRWKAPRHIAKFFTAGVWLVVVLITTITFAVHPKDLMGPTGHWCWIMRKNKLSQIMSEYIWMWTIGVITAVLYGIGFLVLRGKLILEGGPRWVRERQDNGVASLHEDEDGPDREMRTMANQLLMYPLVYLVCITPQSFGRWFFFSGYDVPYQFTLFGRTLFSLSGLFNVLLFFNTRYDLVIGAPSTESLDAATPNEKYGPSTSPSPVTPNPMDTFSRHGRLPDMANVEGRASMKGFQGSGEFSYMTPRGRDAEPSSSREPSSSAHRAARTDEEEEEDFGRPPF